MEGGVPDVLTTAGFDLAENNKIESWGDQQQESDATQFKFELAVAGIKFQSEYDTERRILCAEITCAVPDVFADVETRGAVVTVIDIAESLGAKRIKLIVDVSLELFAELARLLLSVGFAVRSSLRYPHAQIFTFKVVDDDYCHVSSPCSPCQSIEMPKVYLPAKLFEEKDDENEQPHARYEYY
jgi:hypothetical protein